MGHAAACLRVFRLVAAVSFLPVCGYSEGWRLPVDCSLDSIRLTRIGAFGLFRRARPGVPAHLHTGTDFARPSKNYADEPVYPVARGRVVSLRDDGPYAQLIVEHRLPGSLTLWTVYEHVAGIRCSLGDSVCPPRPIARFMSRRELDRHGWQFDHLHLELLRVPPPPRRPDPRLPYCKLMTYGLSCYSREELETRYLDPVEFLGVQRIKTPPSVMP